MYQILFSSYRYNQHLRWWFIIWRQLGELLFSHLFSQNMARDSMPHIQMYHMRISNHHNTHLPMPISYIVSACWKTICILNSHVIAISLTEHVAEVGESKKRGKTEDDDQERGRDMKQTRERTEKRQTARNKHVPKSLIAWNTSRFHEALLIQPPYEHWWLHPGP